jgi:hypothetical protein
MRKFNTGATRGSDTMKYDPEGFENPFVKERFYKYMHNHRVQADGEPRDSDNWQKGIDRNAYMKSLLRHVQDLHLVWRGGVAVDPETGKPVDMEELACAIIFNANGFLFETLVENGDAVRQTEENE